MDRREMLGGLAAFMFADVSGASASKSVLPGAEILSGPLHIGEFGPAADGETDDAAIINGASAEAAGRGVPLVFDGSATYFIDPTTQVLTGSGVWQTNGATFLIGAKETASDSPSVVLSDNFSADEITAVFAANHARGVQVGSSVRIGRLAATCSTYSAADDSGDGLVRLTGSGAVIGELVASNQQRCVNVIGDGNDIGRIRITDYVQGVLNGGSRTRIGHISATGRNVNATGAPGENALLHRGGDHCVYGSVRSEDAGEHAVRLGGAASYAGIRIDSIVAVNPTGNAFKCRPAAGIRSSFSIGSIIAEDAGSGTPKRTTTADAAVLVERCLDSRIGRIEVRRNRQSYSATNALEVNDISGLTIGALKAEGVSNAFVCARTDDGDVEGLTVRELDGNGSREVAIDLVFAGATRSIRALSITGSVRNVAQKAIRVVNAIDETYTAADFMRGASRPAGAGELSRCKIDLIAEPRLGCIGNGCSDQVCREGG